MKKNFVLMAALLVSTAWVFAQSFVIAGVPSDQYSITVDGNLVLTPSVPSGSQTVAWGPVSIASSTTTTFPLLNVQGRMLNSTTRTPVAEGTAVGGAIYDAASGGNPLIVASDVTNKDGVFDITFSCSGLVTAVTPICIQTPPFLKANTPYYLDLTSAGRHLLESRKQFYYTQIGGGNIYADSIAAKKVSSTEQLVATNVSSSQINALNVTSSEINADIANVQSIAIGSVVGNLLPTASSLQLLGTPASPWFGAYVQSFIGFTGLRQYGLATSFIWSNGTDLSFSDTHNPNAVTLSQLAKCSVLDASLVDTSRGQLCPSGWHSGGAVGSAMLCVLKSC